MCNDERELKDDLERADGDGTGDASSESVPVEAERDRPVGIEVPVNAARVFDAKDRDWTPYMDDEAPLEGIYFSASGRGHPGFGRIIFYNRSNMWSDVCWHELNGVDLSRVKSKYWVYEIENSTCFVPGFDDGNCDFYLDHDKPNLLSESKHYVFRFGERTCQAIAAGLWVEASEVDLRDQPLMEGHPALPLPDYCEIDQLDKREVSCQVRYTPLDEASLIEGIRLHPHTLIEYELLGGKRAGADYVLRLLMRSDRLTSVLLRTDNQEELAQFDGLATHADALPFIELELDIARTSGRKKRGK